MKITKKRLAVVEENQGKELELSEWQQKLNEAGHKKLHQRKCVTYFFKRLHRSRRFRIKRRELGTKVFVKVESNGQKI